MTAIQPSTVIVRDSDRRRLLLRSRDSIAAAKASVRSMERRAFSMPLWPGRPCSLASPMASRAATGGGIAFEVVSIGIVAWKRRTDEVDKAYQRRNKYNAGIKETGRLMKPAGRNSTR
ncbi:MAG: hypothetical protein WAM74_14415 [Xanthobacteraceae bacterium]